MTKKYFTFWHVALSSILSTPMAGIYMIVSNFYIAGLLIKAITSLIIGALFILVYLTSNNLFFHSIPSIFHLIIPTLLLLFFAYKEQNFIEQGIIEGNYNKKSYLSVALVCVSCWILIGFFSYIYLMG